MDKVNYQKQLDELIRSAGPKFQRPGLLLHSCCGPCSTHCLYYLYEYFDITVFYYNPNIYPEDEYLHRLNEQRRFIDSMNRKKGCNIRLIDVPYDHDEFLRAVNGLENEPEGGERCSKCFKLRLEKSMQLARDLGTDYFGTTLTVSPHKNAVLINKIGSDTAESCAGQVKWLPSDFKKQDGYKHSIELSAEYDLYRQNYCGCEFSIWF